MATKKAAKTRRIKKRVSAPTKSIRSSRTARTVRSPHSKPKARVTKSRSPQAKKSQVTEKPRVAKSLTVEKKRNVRSEVATATIRPSQTKQQGQSMTAPRVNRIPLNSVTKSKPKEPKMRAARINQYAYMKAPGAAHIFEVGDTVEVFCDHEKSSDRIRGWIKGIVVQVDNKMVAVQFRSNVYLTDGWMVPDRILWYPLNSEHIRPVAARNALKREKAIPEY